MGANAVYPELLLTSDGRRIQDAAAWERLRRPEIRDLFETHVFGRVPAQAASAVRIVVEEQDAPAMDGKAVRVRASVRYSGPGGEGSIPVLAFLPVCAAPVPALLFLCNRSRHNHLDPARKERTGFWPAEAIVARGYAAVAVHVESVDPDSDDGFRNGAHGVLQPDPAVRTADSWATIAAWAWGGSRVMDWIESEPRIDRARVAVVGHSRGGKTALWCGALDPRFAMIAANGSGCVGAKLSRMELPGSESIAIINERFPHWFCRRFHSYGADESALPLDQHMLLAMLAPRLAYVSSATEDAWAGPRGEFASCVAASPAWGLYGVPGLVGDEFPAPETPLHGGRIGYHLRTGTHDLMPYDWDRYMDFADRHMVVE